jgi:cysteine synthase
MEKRISQSEELYSIVEQRRALVASLNNLPAVRFLSNYFRLFVHPAIAMRFFMWILPLSKLDAGNGKTPPAYELLVAHDGDDHKLKGKTLIWPSSGNTLASAARMVEWFDVDLIGVVNESIPKSKKGQPKLAGGARVKIVHPPKGKSALEYAYTLASHPGNEMIDQYTEWASVEAHVKYTWAHVKREMQRLRLNLSGVCLAMGTTSALVGAECLKADWPEMQIVGTACVSDDQIVPGARTIPQLRVTKFGYEKIVDEDHIVLCSAGDAWGMSGELYRKAFPFGPSTGMAVAAQIQWINRLYELGGEKAIESFCDEHNGNMYFGAVGMDEAAPYLGDYEDVLGISRG